jgi:hypothetical protein
MSKAVDEGGYGSFRGGLSSVTTSSEKTRELGEK